MSLSIGMSLYIGISLFIRMSLYSAMLIIGLPRGRCSPDPRIYLGSAATWTSRWGARISPDLSDLWLPLPHPLAVSLGFELAERFVFQMM